MTDEAKIDGTAAGLHVQVGILGERVSGIEKNLGGQIGSLSQQLTSALIEIKTGYATSGALEAVKGDVAGIKASIGWAVKIVLGLVLASLVGLLFAKGGVPHP